MPPQPLPAFWTEEVDAKGRRFYSNHITQTTRWERPAPNEHPHPWEGPPSFSRNNTPVQQISGSRAPRKTANCGCTPRIAFWIAAAMVLPAWIFSVSAAVDDSWLDGVSLSAVDKDILDKCADDDLPTDNYDFCDLYVSFMMMQFISTILASVALALFSMALFLPVSDWCCSAKRLGIWGGWVLTASALFQLIAVILMMCIERADGDTVYFFDDPDAGHVVGATFWVAVVGYVFSMSDAIFILNFVSSAGDGLFYEFISKLSTSND